MKLLTIAMAKGRVADEAIQLIERTGLYFPDYHNESRKLLFKDDRKHIKLIFVKAVDVPTYVEKGAADIGLVGKDILMEDPKEVYELMDLGIGKCKLSVAGFVGAEITESSYLSVASKYPNVAKAYFEEMNIRTDIIKLNGSVELAPLIGMADVIVDIVETGTTLKENGLTVLADIVDISVKLIVNKASYAIKTDEIQQFMKHLYAGLEVRI